MDTFFQYILICHIAGGSVGLITGLMNIVRKKGDKPHKVIGSLFFYSMLTAGISSLILSIIHPNYFLFMVGVFMLYMVFTGNRYIQLYHHGQDSPHKIKMTDWMVSLTMLLAGILFIAFGVLILTRENLFGLVFFTFGFFGCVYVRQDYINFNGKSKIKNFALIAHLQRMTGAFISALTAFLVVNSDYFPSQIPGFIYWLLPTIFVTPLIIFWSRKFEEKKK
jgi:uncharacterized membrane protein